MHSGSVESTSRSPPDDCVRSIVRRCLSCKPGSAVLVVRDTTEVGVLSCCGLFDLVVGRSRVASFSLPIPASGCDDANLTLRYRIGAAQCEKVIRGGSFRTLAIHIRSNRARS